MYHNKVFSVKFDIIVIRPIKNIVANVKISIIFKLKNFLPNEAFFKLNITYSLNINFYNINDLGYILSF